jgi:F0F1-type ATP synthase delta subunit
MDAEQRVKELEQKKKLLMQSLGKENFNSIVDAITYQIRKNKLDTTPTILKDLFDYLIESISF